ncbi:hypothetical protein CVT24_004482 [Panaeolus cyanescens]|uniref:Uncharacterized protein n=1 Tax=Panaeolus cyanescens TaxID=181874 RepID=A0A409YBN7_9AGAR|nr:hypothetical protein CVT24_004482 [Panaeolus cyanescens]
MSSSEPTGPTSQAVVSDDEHRPQAGPLPSKRGEIGYVEGVHSNGSNVDTPPIGDATPALPSRHPADRDAQTPPPPTSATALDATGVNTPSNDQQVQPPTPTSPAKQGSRASRIICGFQLGTLCVFAAQISLLAGTIVGWVFAVKLLRNLSNGQSVTGTSAIFVHVVFVVVVVTELVFLERRVFRLRGERYSYLHPGEILPRHRNLPMSPDTAMSLAPWNRPPLPTYAAALAQSGVGTGDVEDHLIAASPPPAYGNTRGSTLLLSGFLRDSLRAQRPASGENQSTPPTSRPVSYSSRDEGLEEGRDSARAQRLEETLNRLEATPSSSVPRT